MGGNGGGGVEMVGVHWKEPNLISNIHYDKKKKEKKVISG